MFQRLGDEGLATGLCRVCGGVYASGAILGQLVRLLARWRDQGFWAAKLIRGQVQDQALFRTQFSPQQPSTLSGN